MSDRSEYLDPDSRLLLFVAGELGDAESSELERELAGDPARSERVQALREARASADQGLAQLDELSPLLNESAAVRHVVLMMRQWQIQNLAAAAALQKTPDRRLRLNPRVVAAAAAVAAAVVVSITVVYRGSVKSPGPVAMQVRPDRVPFDVTQIEPITHDELEFQAVQSLAIDAPPTTFKPIGSERNERITELEVSSAEPFFDVPMFESDTAKP